MVFIIEHCVDGGRRGGKAGDGRDLCEPVMLDLASQVPGRKVAVSDGIHPFYLFQQL